MRAKETPVQMPFGASNLCASEILTMHDNLGVDLHISPSMTSYIVPSMVPCVIMTKILMCIYYSFHMSFATRVCHPLICCSTFCPIFSVLT